MKPISFRGAVDWHGFWPAASLSPVISGSLAGTKRSSQRHIRGIAETAEALLGCLITDRQWRLLPEELSK
ncbi:hypothetical protein Y1Q_0024099 [Alligator mississippiensis]|uniref:Uncharacterized protein n=1 Tax=Alligator mississippiensis TaxID=8496 RepID=A0A151NHW0_ALLMI|nr:hypothetical protein Y1Q_0024099 [Alligator mississippiensis]